MVIILEFFDPRSLKSMIIAMVSDLFWKFTEDLLKEFFRDVKDFIYQKIYTENISMELPCNSSSQILSCKQINSNCTGNISIKSKFNPVLIWWQWIFFIFSAKQFTEGIYIKLYGVSQKFVPSWFSFSNTPFTLASKTSLN